MLFNRNLRPERLDLGPKRLHLRPERLDLRPERLDLRPERLDLRPERLDLRLERLDLRPERSDVGGTNRRTDERMDKQKSPCVLQDFIPFEAAAQKQSFSSQHWFLESLCL